MWSSPEARRSGTPSGAAGILFFVRNLLLCVSLSVLSFLVSSTPALTQDSPPRPAVQPETKEYASEIATHDEPTTFRVNVKLVVVRAVVRDSLGNAVGNLHQEDFQLFDRGKPQVITQFDVEQPGTVAAKAFRTSVENSGDTPSGETSSAIAKASAAPERFIAYLFDDVHLEFGDLAHVREAAERHFATLKPTDRAAIFTTSGQTNLDFTDDRAKLHEALIHLKPTPINSRSFKDVCPEISYYQADLIVNKHDNEATQIAVQEAGECGPIASADQGHGSVPLGNPAALVNGLSLGVLSAGEHESRVSLFSLKDVVHSLSRMPGQRSIVVVSPGFITPDLDYELVEVIDRAVRSQVVINTLDARGLYVVVPYGDASHQPPVVPGDMFTNAVSASKTIMETTAASAQDDLLAALADGTGGVFFHNNNDFDDGLRRVSDTPAYSYVLAFVPQNLKLDGSFHTLKITLKNSQKLTLQARRGYYAPKNFASPDEQAKQEIEDEMYSQEELHNLPVDLHTQFFMAADDNAKLVVLAHVDVKRLHFRKVEGRNDNVLTCVSALFNRNGNFIEGTQKVVTMHWKDETLEHKLASGITLKTSFDVKPGSYLVRLVVRDAEGQSMSAENGTVEIR
jgi:VWFA-related protein